MDDWHRDALAQIDRIHEFETKLASERVLSAGRFLPPRPSPRLRGGESDDDDCDDVERRFLRAMFYYVMEFLDGTGVPDEDQVKSTPIQDEAIESATLRIQEYRSYVSDDARELRSLRELYHAVYESLNGVPPLSGDAVDEVRADDELVGHIIEDVREMAGAAEREAELRVKVEELQSKLEEQSKEVDEVNRLTSEAVDNLQIWYESVDEQRDTIAAHERTIQELNAQIKALQEGSDRLRGDASREGATVASLRRELIDQKLEMAELASQVEKAKAEVAKLLMRNTECTTEVFVARDSLQKITTDYNTRIKRCRGRMKTLMDGVNAALE